MAKVEMDSAFASFSGGLGNIVYRKTSGGVVAAKRAQINAPPSEAQTTIREQFRAAAAYAKGVLVDPVQLPRYAAAAAAQGLRTWPFAMMDFLRPPTVHAIDTSAYHGAVGNAIGVTATDELDVVAVNVTIRGAGDAVLEQGAAALVNGAWRYTATHVVAVGTAVMIEATATGRPGNNGFRSLAYTVA